jgi:hypothetical protein
MFLSPCNDSSSCVLNSLQSLVVRKAKRYHSLIERSLKNRLTFYRRDLRMYMYAANNSYLVKAGFQN